MRSRIFFALVLALIATVFLVAFTHAQGAPTPVTDLRAEISGTSVILTWTHTDATVDHYQVWWSDSPYGAPGDAGVVHIADVPAPGVLNDPVTYTDTASGVGNSTVNSFYFVRSVNGSGEASEPSNRDGEFDFGLNGAEDSLPILDHCGTISADEIWGPNAVHRVTCDVTISVGVKLTMLAGTVVKPQTTSTSLVVNGSLFAQGSSMNQIYITSLKDDSVGGDTNGDGDASQPTPGAWGAIRIGNEGTATFSHAVVKYGGTNISSSGNLTISESLVDSAMDNGVYTSGGVFYLTQTTVSNNGKGVRVENTMPLSITNTEVSSNTGDGLTVLADTVPITPTITNNILSDNTNFAMYLNFENNMLVLDESTLNGNQGMGNGVNGIGLWGRFRGDNVLAPQGNLVYVVPKKYVPYNDDRPLVISTDSTLVLRPGTIFKMTRPTTNTATNLDVEGVLEVEGEIGNEIIFTSLDIFI